MGYLHIENLYKAQDILLFKECYALEKVHGTSAHIAWPGSGGPTFFAGGASHEHFVALFDPAVLAAQFARDFEPGVEVRVHGEAYGGKCQGMRETYGPELRFIVFDVQVGDVWLAVPQMAAAADKLGLEVVPFRRIPTDTAALNAERDRPSEVAERRGCGVRPREGVVLRPLIELRKNNGDRVIAKHRIELRNERKTPQAIDDPAKLAVLTAAAAIADEWVTSERLSHVLDHLRAELGREPAVEDTRAVLSAMVEDVYREAKGEIVEGRAVEAAIGKKTAGMFHARLKAALRQPESSPAATV